MAADGRQAEGWRAEGREAGGLVLAYWQGIPHRVASLRAGESGGRLVRRGGTFTDRCSVRYRLYFCSSLASGGPYVIDEIGLPSEVEAARTFKQRDMGGPSGG